MDGEHCHTATEETMEVKTNLRKDEGCHSDDEPEPYTECFEDLQPTSETELYSQYNSSIKQVSPSVPRSISIHGTNNTLFVGCSFGTNYRYFVGDEGTQSMDGTISPADIATARLKEVLTEVPMSQEQSTNNPYSRFPTMGGDFAGLLPNLDGQFKLIRETIDETFGDMYYRLIKLEEENRQLKLENECLKKSNNHLNHGNKLTKSIWESFLDGTYKEAPCFKPNISRSTLSFDDFVIQDEGKLYHSELQDYIDTFYDTWMNDARMDSKERSQQEQPEAQQEEPEAFVKYLDASITISLFCLLCVLFYFGILELSQCVSVAKLVLPIVLFLAIFGPPSHSDINALYDDCSSEGSYSHSNNYSSGALYFNQNFSGMICTVTRPSFFLGNMHMEQVSPMNCSLVLR